MVRVCLASETRRYDRFGGLRLRGKRRGWNTCVLATMVICTALFLYQDVLEMFQLLRAQPLESYEAYAKGGARKDIQVDQHSEMNVVDKSTSSQSEQSLVQNIQGQIESSSEKETPKAKASGQVPIFYL